MGCPLCSILTLDVFSFLSGRRLTGLDLGRGQDRNRVITAASHDLTAEVRVTIGQGAAVAAPRAVPAALYPEVQSAMLRPRAQLHLTRMAMIEFRCRIRAPKLEVVNCTPPVTFLNLVLFARFDKCHISH